MTVSPPASAGVSAAPASTESRLGLTMHDKVMVAIVGVTLAANCLLISPAEGTEAGHRPWGAGSVLRVIAELQALNYRYPTHPGVEVKWLVQGLGAAMALLAGTVIWFSRTRPDPEDIPEVSVGGGPPASPERPGRDASSALALSTAAQIALLLFAGWVMISALWAPWPAAALGEGARQLILTVWAVAIGRALTRNGARAAATAMVVVLAITALLGIWYYVERNPTQRLKYPIGNPIFLAACLLPGITLAAARLGGAGQGMLARSNGEQRKPWSAGQAAAAMWALLPLLGALVLADSRGPVLGLAVGLGLAVFLAARWRARWALLVIVAFGAAGAWWLRLGPVSWMLSRPDTVRLRLYAWRYATTLFLSRPDIGRGQGAYLLLSQQMSRPDAERDPGAFPAPLFGHAHNEWLEILGDLGVVGFALMAAAIGLTLWSAWVSLRRSGSTPGRWVLWGLLAALVALVVEEATDVALRFPGLPLIFYTVIGLIWAVSRETRPPSPSIPRGPARLLRPAVLAGGIVASVGLTWIAARDWQSAMANGAILKCAEDFRWDEAQRQAELAGRGALVLERRLAAASAATSAAYEAAEHQVRQIREMIGRLDPEQRVRPGILAIAREDAATFMRFFTACQATASALLERIPAYPNVAAVAGEAWLLREEMERALQHLGILERASSWTEEARQRLAAEYSHDRLNAELALRLLQLSGDQPADVLIDLLRIPLRKGPVWPAVEPALRVLMPRPGFSEMLGQRLIEAQAALTLSLADDWPDRYAPETLRLAALAGSLAGAFGEAVAQAGESVRLYRVITDRFPAAVSYAQLDEARYLLLADPEHPRRAAEVAQQAARDCAPGPDRPFLLGLIHRDLSLYLLAMGDEEAARRVLVLVDPSLEGQRLDRNVGYGLSMLCGWFVAFPPDRRPAAFGGWLRRSLELAPQEPTTLRIGAVVALERGENQAAMRHLEALREAEQNPEQLATFTQSLAERFKDNPDLQAFIAALDEAREQDTPPIASRPASAPHGRTPAPGGRRP